MKARKGSQSVFSIQLHIVFVTKSAFWSGSYYVASTGGAPIESNFGL
ncbi:hypothetical protein [Coleofasciculus chthonoplastes]